MTLFTKHETQSLESAAQQEGVTLESMMDQAGLALAQEIQTRFSPQPGQLITILCGKGNNGGDGFVCARSLSAQGLSCSILLLHGSPQTGLAAQAFARLPNSVPILPGDDPSAQDLLTRSAILVDCVYGFGFRGQLDPPSIQLFTLANRLPCQRISADLPSGAECDTGRVSPGTFQAHVTVSFTVEKIAHHCYPAKSFCGEIVTRPVGIPPRLVSAAQTHSRLTSPQDLLPLLLPPDPQANKGSQGRLLLICGSYGMAGACIMAARAALRCGVGLLHIAADSRIYPILAAAVPEAVFSLFDPTNPASVKSSLLPALASCSACVIGCGLGELADLLCPLVFSHRQCPLLLDADALNYCARSGACPAPSGLPLVITPHPGETSRLLGRSVSDIQSDRIAAAQALAKNFSAAALLKGAATVIAAPEGQLALNPTGNPGMAKGGSGDVLSGMIGALLAQGVSAFPAAMAGAYLHGAAGDLCRDELSARAMLPTDLIQALPRIFKKFESL